MLYSEPKKPNANVNNNFKWYIYFTGYTLKYSWITYKTIISAIQDLTKRSTGVSVIKLSTYEWCDIFRVSGKIRCAVCILSKMDETKVHCKFFCEGQINNRRNLFKECLSHAQTGKVLYILKEELNELPQLSQDICVMNKNYLKMISFLYVSTLEALIESLVGLPVWQNVPHTIILEDLGEYCDKNDKHSACGIIGFLLDCAVSCSNQLRTPCNLYISINVDIVGEDYCNLMQELYE